MFPPGNTVYNKVSLNAKIKVGEGFVWMFWDFTDPSKRPAVKP
jgi:hypothetical protein